MAQFAMIGGPVFYTPGDGVPIEIPQGRVEVKLAVDSATLSWEAAKDTTGLAAIPRTAFDEYVESGKITLGDGDGSIVNEQLWKITFEVNGKLSTIEMSWRGRPEEEHVAQVIRERCLPHPHLIPDTPREATEPTILQIADHGYRITSIDQIADDASERDPS